MRKITRKTLDELSKKMPQLGRKEMISIYASGDGTHEFPYTVAEYTVRLNSGSWDGGYVETYGYVLPGVDVTGGGSGNYRDFEGSNGFGYTFAENVGLSGYLWVDGTVSVGNGNISIHLEGRCANPNYTLMGFMDIIVDGQVVSTSQCELSPHGHITGINMDPVGIASCGIPTSGSRLEVKVTVFGQYYNGIGFSQTPSYSQIVYSEFLR